MSLTLLALREKGVEVVRADINDIESLKNAFRGVHGVFGVTNCAYFFHSTILSLALKYNDLTFCSHHTDWDPAVFNEEKEFVQGKTLVDAAKAASVKHFFS